MSYNQDDAVVVLEQRGLCGDFNEYRRRFGYDVMNECMGAILTSRDPAAAAEDWLVWADADDRDDRLDEDAMLTRAREAAAVTRTPPEE